MSQEKIITQFLNSLPTDNDQGIDNLEDYRIKYRGQAYTASEWQAAQEADPNLVKIADISTLTSEAK